MGFRFLSFRVRFAASGVGVDLKVRFNKETFILNSHQEQDIVTVPCIGGEPLRLDRGFPKMLVSSF